MRCLQSRKHQGLGRGSLLIIIAIAGENFNYHATQDGFDGWGCVKSEANYRPPYNENMSHALYQLTSLTCHDRELGIYFLENIDHV